MANEAPTRLKLLLQQHHLFGYGIFCLEYDKIAKAIDPKLAGSYPSCAQFHRWGHWEQSRSCPTHTTVRYLN